MYSRTQFVRKPLIIFNCYSCMHFIVFNILFTSLRADDFFLHDDDECLVITNAQVGYGRGRVGKKARPGWYIPFYGISCPIRL